jgi:CRISPR/Cas system CSM-associated protein Csm3 (group 7 of RAMP superfamily)
LRDQVSIRDDTKTAKDEAKFIMEVVEPGVIFPLYVEVELNRINTIEDKKKLLAILLHIFQKEWAEGKGIIGGGSARGRGWFHLEDIKFVGIKDKNDLRLFIDNGDTEKWIDEQIKNKKNIDPASMIKEINIEINTPALKIWEFKIKIKEEDDEYGIWPLLIRDSSSDQEFTKIRKWELTSEKRWESNFLPIIPGSSLRGVVRHHFARLGKEIDELFGTEEEGSRLKFSDALFIKPNGKYEQQVEHIALDEFTRAAYKRAKFEETPIFKGCFQGKIMLEEPQNDEIALIESIFTWGNKKFSWIGLGAHSTPVIWEKIK